MLSGEDGLWIVLKSYARKYRACSRSCKRRSVRALTGASHSATWLQTGGRTPRSTVSAREHRYDNVLIRDDVKVGCYTWIGPSVVLDGQGGLEIGDYCSISAGVQIYTHHMVRWSVQLGAARRDVAPTRIGNGVFIGPNSVVQMGVVIGDRAVIGAMSFVNREHSGGRQSLGLSRPCRRNQ